MWRRFALVVLVVLGCGRTQRDRAGASSPSQGGDSAEATGGSPGPDSDCLLVMPGDGTIEQALATVTPPAKLCLVGGKYNGNVELPDGVGLYGMDSGVDICGYVDVTQATELGVFLTHVNIHSQVRANAGVNLSLSEVTIVALDREDDFCSQSKSEPAIDIQVPDSSPLRFSADALYVDSPGLHFAFPNSGSAPIDADISIRRSSCNSVFQCWDMASFDFGPEVAASGSRLKIELVNNLVSPSVLESFAFWPLTLMPEDIEASSLRIINNTIYSPYDSNYGVVFWGDWNTPLVIANNAIGSIANPLFGVPDGATLEANQLAEIDADEWFVGPHDADFRPSFNSPLVDSAADEYLPETDFKGLTRGTSDIGAFAYTAGDPR